MKVVGKRVADIDAALVDPGSFRITTDTDGNEAGTAVRLWFMCPCGCGTVGQVPLRGKGAWIWDRNLDAPTLSPSIQRVGGCNWHGFLRSGVWEWA